MTNAYYVAGIPFNSHDSLTHHGIKGQKWGIRRYQNSDGSLTEEGKKRYYEHYGYNDDHTWDKQSSVKEEKRNDEIRNRLGDELTTKAQDKMFDVLSKIYEADFTDYSGKYKKEYNRIVTEGKRLEQAQTNKFVELRAKELESMPKVSKVRELFERFTGSYVDPVRKAGSIANEKMQNTKEQKDYMAWVHKYKSSRDNNPRHYGYLSELRDKMAGEWKDKTIRDILKEVPESKKDDLWEYLRFNWWDYD